jgi:hypothetical protein
MDQDYKILIWIFAILALTVIIPMVVWIVVNPSC